MIPPEVCPVCQEEVPRHAKACPECGADERSGWNEDALLYDGLDLPDHAWGEEEDTSIRSPDHVPLIWKIMGILALIGMLWWFIGALFQ